MSEAIASKTKALFKGIFQVFTGVLGWRVAMVAYLQLALQAMIAANHTKGTVLPAVLFAVALLVAQASAALITCALFSFRAAKQSDAKKRPSPNLLIWETTVVSVLLVFLLNVLTVKLVGQIAQVGLQANLYILEALLASLQARTLLFAISGLSTVKK